MKSYVVSSSHGLSLLRDRWNALAGDVPFRAHEWLATWWKHYDSEHMRRRELHVVCVTSDDGQLVGLAPWYLDRSLAKGRMVRWLGDGKVCTDHLTLLCEPEYRIDVAATLAQHLVRDFLDWDLGKAISKHRQLNESPLYLCWYSTPGTTYAEESVA